MQKGKETEPWTWGFNSGCIANRSGQEYYSPVAFYEICQGVVYQQYCMSRHDMVTHPSAFQTAANVTFKNKQEKDVPVLHP